MLSKIPKTNESRRATSKKKVEDAACALFVDRGFKNTSADMIAAGAGLTKGTLYFYYKGKESLLLTLLDKAEKHFFDSVFQSMDKFPDDEIKQIDRFLDQMIVAPLKLKQELLLLPLMMSSEFKSQNSEPARKVDLIYQRIYKRITKTIMLGQTKNIFASTKSPESLAAMIVALTDGLLLDLYRGGSGVDGREIAAAARLTIHGLLKP